MDNRADPGTGDGGASRASATDGRGGLEGSGALTGGGGLEGSGALAGGGGLQGSGALAGGGAGGSGGGGGAGGSADGGAGETGGEESDAGKAGPAELLGQVRAIRRSTRLARHAYWFPLVLFGLLTCGSVPFYLRQFPVSGQATYFRLSGLVFLRSGYLGGYGLFEIVHGAAYYWLGAMLIGIVATVIWYRWRGNRVGLRTPARSYLITGLALVALALLIPVVSGGGSASSLTWPFDYVISDLFPLVLIGLGLCVLAWAERSTGLAAIATVYLALAIVVNLYILSNVLARLHRYLSPAAAALPKVLLPALVLLLSGAGAWLMQRRQPAHAPED
jgi:hypothetical protein